MQHNNSLSLSGTLPIQLGLLTNLKRHDLSHDALYGTIPSEILLPRNLQNNNLNGNQIQSPFLNLVCQTPNLMNFLGISSYYCTNNYNICVPNYNGIYISCDGFYQVTQIYKYYYGLLQTIPTEIGLLVTLQYLNINDNQVYGTIPTEIGFLVNLKNLNFYQNQLSGTVPTQLALLSNLQSLDISYNYFSGGIPTLISQLPHLQYISSNNYNQIAVQVGDTAIVCKTPYLAAFLGILSSYCKNAINICGMSNSFNCDSIYSGKISRIYNSKLSGTIPTELGLLSSLYYIRLSYNKLNGTIPTQLGLLTNLETLYLDNNNLDGPVPIEISNLPLLSDFRHDSFNKVLVSSVSVICQYQNLITFLGASYKCHNNITLCGDQISCDGKDQVAGINVISSELSIPTEIGLLTTLITFDTYYSQTIRGSIPTQLGLLTRLRILKISGNPSLSGTIPTQLGLLTNLQQLDLSYNNLNGTVPTELSQLTNIISWLSAGLYGNHLSSPYTNLICNTPNLMNFLGLYSYDCTHKKDLCDSNYHNMFSCNNLYQITNVYNYYNYGLRPIPTELGLLMSLQHIYLYGFDNLYGTIPTELGMLTNMQSIVVSNSKLFGTIPTQIGLLTRLQTLHLKNNKLSGTMPTQIGFMSNLYYLELHNNQLFGTIPTQVGLMTNLKFLYLNNNKLSGTIPTQIGFVSNLYNLELDNNQLFGTIPTQVGFMTNLEHLHLNNNKLSGTIPTEIGLMTSLQKVWLYKNQLNQTLPTQIKLLTHLTEFLMVPPVNPICRILISWNLISTDECDTDGTYLCSNNQFHTNIICDVGGSIIGFVFPYRGLVGAIPTLIGELTSLQTLNLGFNYLTGAIPTEIGKLINLKSLDLGINMLTNIPTEIGKLSNLETLRLVGNLITGNIPVQIKNLVNLQYLYLAANQLSGDIPLEIELLSQLRTLDLSHNSLTGYIPTQIKALINLKTLNLGYNVLTGIIPTEIKSLVNLQNLNLYANQLSGYIPTEIINLASLKYLSLGYNSISDEIPAQIRDMASLQYFDLIAPVKNDILNWLGQSISFQYILVSIKSLASTIFNMIANSRDLGISPNLVPTKAPSKFNGSPSMAPTTPPAPAYFSVTQTFSNVNGANMNDHMCTLSIQQAVSQSLNGTVPPKDIHIRSMTPIMSTTSSSFNKLKLLGTQVIIVYDIYFVAPPGTSASVMYTTLSQQLSNSIISGKFEKILQKTAQTNGVTGLASVSASAKPTIGDLVTQAPTSAPNTQIIPSSEKNSGLSIAMIGGIVGGVLVFVLIALLNYYYFCNKKSAVRMSLAADDFSSTQTSFVTGNFGTSNSTSNSTSRTPKFSINNDLNI